MTGRSRMHHPDGIDMHSPGQALVIPFPASCQASAGSGHLMTMHFTMTAPKQVRRS